MCLKPQISKDRIRNAKDRQIRPGINGVRKPIRRSDLPVRRRPKISSNRKRPCLRFKGLPKNLRRCRKRYGLTRLKRETNEHNYGRSILHVHKVKRE